jgi:hypothetical protein
MRAATRLTPRSAAANGRRTTLDRNNDRFELGFTNAYL